MSTRNIGIEIREATEELITLRLNIIKAEKDIVEMRKDAKRRIAEINELYKDMKAEILKEEKPKAEPKPVVIDMGKVKALRKANPKMWTWAAIAADMRVSEEELMNEVRKAGIA